MEAAVADLLAVIQDDLYVAAAGKVQPDEVAQQMGVGLRHIIAVVGREVRSNALFYFLLGGLHALAVGDLQPPSQDVAQQAIGFALGLRMGAALEEVEAFAKGGSARVQR